jgi:sugar phosphate isomerase/epimerase
VGLWIPHQAAEQLVGGQRDSFREFLSANCLVPYTINGFPYANFHGDHVKHRVYLPTWAEPARLEYTRHLAEILAELLDEEHPTGSISTLPLGWPGNPFSARDAADPAPETESSQLIEQSGKQLRSLADFLQRLHGRTGKHIVVAIEPEPGCTLDSIDDMVAFFDAELPEAHHRRYLTACHDICHSAVMNEPQRQVILRYAEAGIAIGKVQVSNAIVVDWSAIAADDRAAALRQLGEFAEDRYLHQTGQVDNQGGFALAEDLPGLIRDTSTSDLADARRWVVHFHVPIFLQQFGQLSTSRDAVVE